MKKIITILAFVSAFVIPLGTRASFSARVSQNNIEINGDCSSNVLVTLAKTDNPDKIVYSGGVSCQEGKFSFADDLLKWNMEDGKYSIMVNGQKSGKTVERKERILSVQDEPAENAVPSISSGQAVAAPVAETAINDPAGENAAAEPEPEKETADPDTKFLDAFVAFQQSLLDMRIWLAETKYPAFIKKGIDSALDGIDLVAGKISESLWSSDNPSGAGESVDGGQAEIPAEDSQKIEAAPKIIPAEQPDSQTVASEVLLKTDGLDVSGGNIP